MDHHLGSFLDHICQVQSRASVTEGATSNLGDSARREFVSAKTTEEQSPHTQIMTSRTFVCSVKFGGYEPHQILWMGMIKHGDMNHPF
jgi:hypothetical protein